MSHSQQINVVTPLKPQGLQQGQRCLLLNFRGDELGSCAAIEKGPRSWTLSWTQASDEFPSDSEIAWFAQPGARIDEMLEVSVGHLRIHAEALSMADFMKLFRQAAFHEPPAFYIHNPAEPKLDAGLVWFSKDRATMYGDWKACYILRSLYPTVAVTLELKEVEDDSEAPTFERKPLKKPRELPCDDTGAWLYVRSRLAFLGGPRVYKVASTLESLLGQ